MTKYDVIWYWSGGREVGVWQDAIWDCLPDYKSMDQTLADIRGMGIVAHPGKRNIGKPYGPPSESDFKSVGV